ncbi:MAG: hypothetical protein SCK29_07655 [Bacillota bacterium]|nr:hypothetical protein [Bacillota bacterium]MDW7683975.1 hypothetical protein [Bacillota bacterium]
MENVRGWAAVSLFFTAVWLVLMVFSVSQTGAVSTIEQALDYAVNSGLLFQATYVNAVLVTLAVTVFFAYLSEFCKSLNPGFAVTGIVFVSVYCLLNLFVYFSQITILPRLLAAVHTSANPEIYRILAGQFVQLWPGSVTAILNQLAYGLLGIPSILFGILLIQHRETWSLAGWLLVLNGMACIIGIFGTVAGNSLLAAGSVAGGALFLFAMLAITMKKGTLS